MCGGNDGPKLLHKDGVSAHLYSNTLTCIKITQLLRLNPWWLAWTTTSKMDTGYSQRSFSVIAATVVVAGADIVRMGRKTKGKNATSK